MHYSFIWLHIGMGTPPHHNVIYNKLKIVVSDGFRYLTPEIENLDPEKGNVPKSTTTRTWTKAGPCDDS